MYEGCALIVAHFQALPWQTGICVHDILYSICICMCIYYIVCIHMQCELIQLDLMLQKDEESLADNRFALCSSGERLFSFNILAKCSLMRERLSIPFDILTDDLEI